MIVSFNPNVSNNKNLKFGTKQSAIVKKSAIETALNTSVQGIKITREEAIKRAQEGIKSEDKAGKSFLRKYIEQLIRNKPQSL